MPCALTYIGSRFVRSLRSTWYVVVSKDWIINDVLFCVLEVHDTARLSYCPPRVLEGLKTLLLQGVLGANGSADVERFFSRIERVRWDEVPPWHNCCSSSEKRDQFPGRTCEAGDFECVELLAGEVVTDVETKARRADCYTDGEEPYPPEQCYFSHHKCPVCEFVESDEKADNSRAQAEPAYTV